MRYSRWVEARRWWLLSVISKQAQTIRKFDQLREETVMAEEAYDATCEQYGVDSYRLRWHELHVCEIRAGSGVDGNWWTSGFNDTAWSTQGYVDWHTDWTTYGWSPVPEIGPYVWKAGPGWPDGRTDLHRRAFNLSIPTGYTLTAARIKFFSDNRSRWYLNGVLVADLSASFSNVAALPTAIIAPGSNLLAVAVSNDNFGHNSNPMGIQYILEVYLSPNTPTPTVPRQGHPPARQRQPRPGRRRRVQRRLLHGD